MVNQIHTMKDKETGTWYNKQDGAKRASNAGFATQKKLQMQQGISLLIRV